MPGIASIKYSRSASCATSASARRAAAHRDNILYRNWMSGRFLVIVLWDCCSRDSDWHGNMARRSDALTDWDTSWCRQRQESKVNHDMPPERSNHPQNPGDILMHVGERNVPPKRASGLTKTKERQNVMEKATHRRDSRYRKDNFAKCMGLGLGPLTHPN